MNGICVAVAYNVTNHKLTVFPQTWDLHQAYAGRYFFKRAKYLPQIYPVMSAYMPGLWPKVPGLWGGDLPGDLQEKCPRSPGAVPWMSQSTHYKIESTGKSGAAIPG